MTRPSSEPRLALYVGVGPGRSTPIDGPFEDEHGRFTVETASGVGEALDRLADAGARIDCVVSAFDLPDGDGIELLEAVRERSPHLPFVLVAEEGSERIASDAISAGITDYVSALDGDESGDSLADRVVGYAEGYRTQRSPEHRPSSRGQRLDQYETMLKTLPVGVAVLDETGGVEWADEAFCGVFGRTTEEVMGTPFPGLIEAELVDSGIADQYRGAVRELLSSATDTDRVTIEFEHQPPYSDTPRWYEGYIALQPLRDGEFDGTISAFLDVTERKRRERELEQYRAAMETVPDGVFLLDEHGTMIRVNEAWASTVGYDPSELNGEPFPKLVDGGVIDRSLVEAYLDILPTLLSSETEQERAKFTTRFSPPGGTEERVYEVHIGLLPYDEGFQGAAGVVRDITGKIEHQQQLERKNERLEEFASIVSHDIRNPLSVAKAFTERAHETDDVTALEEAMRALDRMEAITRDVLELARQGRIITDASPVYLPRQVEECWKTVETGGAELRTDGVSGVHVVADEDRLRQLLENLVRNAVEHGGDDVTVRVGTTESGFYLEDDGPGIPEDDREGVFEAGYTTSSEGTGFGLNIVERIVDAHGWRIATTDGTDGGARLEITGVEFSA